MNEEILELPVPVIELLSALTAGLIIGLERGWRDRELAAGGRVAGLRTFALLGLLGGVLGTVHERAGAWPLAAGLLGLAFLGALSYRENVRETANLSVTSAVAQLMTFSLGALAALGQPALAVGASVVVAVLLNLRPALHRWLRMIEHRELSAGLQMLLLSAVILPLLPDAAYGPYGALNPYRLWWAVVLIAGLSLSGHVAMRLTGTQRGILWTGLLGGLASSTAATLALARRARGEPQLLEAASAGALAACAMMFFRMSLIAVSLSPAFAKLLLPALMSAGVSLMLAAWWRWRRRQMDAPTGEPSDVPPFDLGTALGFGLFLGLMSVLTQASKAWLGASGLYGLALLTGIADVDAITVAMTRMQAAAEVADGVAAVAIGLAVAANMAAKAGMAWLTAGSAMGSRVAAGYGVSVLAGAIALASAAALA